MSLHPSPQFCTSATRPSCVWDGKRWRRETRPSLVGVAGRSRFPTPLVVGLAEQGGRAPTPHLYKERAGRMASRILSSSSSFSFCSSLPSVMERGNPGPSTVAARVAAQQRVPPSPAPAVAKPATRGRGRWRGRGRGRGARGRGGRGGAPALPPPMMPFPMEGHVGDQPREFFIRLRRPPRRRLRLRLHLRGRWIWIRRNRCGCT